MAIRLHQEAMAHMEATHHSKALMAHMGDTHLSKQGTWGTHLQALGALTWVQCSRVCVTSLLQSNLALSKAVG